MRVALHPRLYAVDVQLRDSFATCSRLVKVIETEEAHRCEGHWTGE
jgi:hypothetical protein